jgi:hypothetical protein
VRSLLARHCGQLVHYALRSVGHFLGTQHLHGKVHIFTRHRDDCLPGHVGDEWDSSSCKLSRFHVRAQTSQRRAVTITRRFQSRLAGKSPKWATPPMKFLRLPQLANALGEDAFPSTVRRSHESLDVSSPPENVDKSVDDRRASPREGSERRRKSRPVLREDMKAHARSRSRGTCECSSQSCWHFHQCKAPGVAYLTRNTAAGLT